MLVKAVSRIIVEAKRGFQYHVLWIIRYRYKILQGKIAERLRELIQQGCSAREITIIRGSVGREHVQMLILCPPTLLVNKIIHLSPIQVDIHGWA
ncbi:MAG: IS200/IS605 family transposase [Oscillospiraceae bacterium]|nr:IS200/IS605 family transposase [Oscillospiraceae bacterium]